MGEGRESEAHDILDRAYERRSRSSLFAALFFPDSKGNPSTAAITERQFQSPADRSRIRTRNLMYYTEHLITWDCAASPLLRFRKNNAISAEGVNRIR